MSAQNYIDIGIIVIILILGLRGMQNGLIQEIAGLLGFVLGIYLATRYFGDVAKYIKYSGLEFENESISLILAFVLILSVVWIGLLVIGAVISRFMVMMPELSIVNYFGGYIFAALKYFLILCAIMYGLSQVEFLKKPIADNFKSTKSYPIMMEIAQKIMNIEVMQNIKKELTDSVVGGAKDTKEQMNKQIEKKKQEIMKSIGNSIK